MYRTRGAQLEVLLVHPGGPFFQRKDMGVWSIPKGEFTEEDPLQAAIREFREETGVLLEGPFHLLNCITQKGGKIVYAWAIKGELDPSNITCNTFELEWPKGSGKMKSFPEIDQAAWFNLEEAKLKILERQLPLIEELVTIACR